MSKTVFILGASSDIGKALVEYYVDDGYNVFGTYRNIDHVKHLFTRDHIHLFPCDISKKQEVATMTMQYQAFLKPWEIFISCIGNMEPIGSFFKSDFDMWEASAISNTTAQLRVLHSFYPLRETSRMSNIVFFAGGGTNGPFRNYSAYCASKIFLIKMCELLDDENPDLNIFIIGPGWVRTKIHEQTINNPSGAQENYEKTLSFLSSTQQETSVREIYDFVNWCIQQGKETVGGRNFSIVHDAWRNGGKELICKLRDDYNAFKLRRFRNSD
ncbi:MAG: SDR family oxidoreductase [Proteobacteria bacterium]|nr:SDR family oxidoreductase [Pseudomonadota bacterium]